jgi:hypothetical protein
MVVVLVMHKPQIHFKMVPQVVQVAVRLAITRLLELGQAERAS